MRPRYAGLELGVAIHLGTAARRNLSDAATLRRFKAVGGYQLLKGACGSGVTLLAFKSCVTDSF